MAATVRPILAAVRYHCRPHLVGTRGTGSHGLRGDCRFTAASGALHAGGGAFGLCIAWNRTPPECWATSATAALLASSVAAALVASAAATASDPETYQAYATAFVLVTGLVFLAAGLAKLGFITQFLSKPVMDGFVMGLAIFVAVGQLNKLFGVAKPEGNTVEKL